MSGQYHKNPIKKLVSLVGVASASVFLSLPGFAQAAPNAGSMNQQLNNSERQIETEGQLIAQTMSGYERNSTCGGYEGNATTGGGYFCALYRMNPNSGGNLYRTSPQGSSSTNNGNSTTGAGYPGNNTRPQGTNDSMNQGSNSSGSNTQDRTSPQGSSSMDNGNSTTGAGYPGNGVTPQGQNNMNR